jgi:hypothetical protein
MRSSSFALVPLSLLALILSVPCAAQTPPATPLSAVAAPAPSSVDAFLATLSGDAGPLPPTSVSTTCHSDEECPTGQLCCYPCGIEGCENICMAPWGKTGECPLFM